MLKELLHQGQTTDHVASYVHHPTTDYIKTLSHKFVSAREDNVGAEFIEISSNKSSIRGGYDKINYPCDSTSLNTKERQLLEILSTLEMVMDCERTDAFPSKKMEMSKGLPEVIHNEYRVLKCICYFAFMLTIIVCCVITSKYVNCNFFSIVGGSCDDSINCKGKTYSKF